MLWVHLVHGGQSTYDHVTLTCSSPDRMCTSWYVTLTVMCEWRCNEYTFSFYKVMGISPSSLATRSTVVLLPFWKFVFRFPWPALWAYVINFSPFLGSCTRVVSSAFHVHIQTKASRTMKDNSVISFDKSNHAVVHMYLLFLHSFLCFSMHWTQYSIIFCPELLFN